jgi:hypothetical protein
MKESKVHTIITAAGDSRDLFIRSGFKQPKSLVLWNNKEVLVNSIHSYAIYSNALTVAINESENNEFNIEKKVNQNYPEAKVVSIKSNVKGALASALLSLVDIKPDSKLVIAAGDSLIKGGILSYIEHFQKLRASAGTIVFKSNNPRWSYLALDKFGVARNVQEKIVVGNYATTGVFYFNSVRDFMDAAKWVLVNKSSINNNFYVSTTLNYLLSKGLKLEYLEVPRNRYVPLSLPSDFQKDIGSNG